MSDSYENDREILAYTFASETDLSPEIGPGLDGLGEDPLQNLLQLEFLHQQRDARIRQEIHTEHALC